MTIAIQVSRASKCKRARYGSVIVSADGRIVSTGYNGKPRGCINDDVCYREGLPDNAPSKPNCCLHSEANAIIFSDPLARIGGTLYVSGVPCTDCLLLLSQSGLAELVYLDNSTGHRGNTDADFVAKYGIKLKITRMEESEIVQ
jgi:dCMP deaminase